RPGVRPPAGRCVRATPGQPPLPFAARVRSRAPVPADRRDERSDHARHLSRLGPATGPARRAGQRGQPLTRLLSIPSRRLQEVGLSYVLTPPDARRAMLETIGAKSIADLLKAIPEPLQLKRPLQVPPALTEIELTQHLRHLAGK